MNYFITAIHTDSGKTLVSAIICEALKADYWKPVQAGSPTDSETIKSLLTNSHTVIHPERYSLRTPASPHAAARIDNISIDINHFTLPQTDRDLVIEGAGGCLVPLNERDFVIDLAGHFGCEVILVSNIYLGSINHTLSTFEALEKRKLPIAGIIFNGPENPDTESIILKHTGLSCLLRIRPEAEITRATVLKYASELNGNWNKRR
jgi:dethiobiotin synthetase